ncbi:MAG: magnesium-protoporphyrin IX monomethyl ester (oxidative) cyclase, partial [Pseudomonadota bacterium]
PIFKWFEKWCNDEFRHGEAFALLMRANPHLLKGANTYWVKFFLLAVFATMYIRDHNRPAFHDALGLDPKEYGHEVFKVTTEISKQCFPVTIDLENPKFYERLEELRRISDRLEAAKAQGGVIGRVKQAGHIATAGVTFARLFFMRSHQNTLPDTSRLEPAW